MKSAHTYPVGIRGRGWQLFIVLLLCALAVLVWDGHGRYTAAPADSAGSVLADVVWTHTLVFLACVLVGGLPAWLFDRSVREAYRHSEVLQKANAVLEYTSLHDPLTGMANRTLLNERLEQAVLSGQRRGESFALLITDLDRFKIINDTLGHAVGDHVLRQIGERLKVLLRDTDTVARLGGDEFAVLAKIDTRDQVGLIAAKVLDQFDAPFDVEGGALTVRASIGVALFPQHGREVDLLMARADMAMYRAKESGSRFAVFETEHEPRTFDRLELLGRIREAIANNELTVWYQPKVDIATDEVSGIEALVRWHHPQYGLLLPGTFMPLAEQSGVIQLITLKVMQHALDYCARLRLQGIDTQVAVNLSPRVFDESDLPQEVAALIKDWGLESRHLQFEITENVVLGGAGNPLQTLAELQDLGVGLSIDDFGVGYSSLSYLKDLPVNELKIDKSFVSNMVNDPRDASIVRSTIELAHSLGLKVVAEGVQSSEIHELLADYGCDAVQGTWFCAAVPEAELTRWMQDRLNRG